MTPEETEALYDELQPIVAQALEAEFSFLNGLGLSGDSNAWGKAARGVLRKLGPHAMEIRFRGPNDVLYRARGIVKLEKEG